MAKPYITAEDIACLQWPDDKFFTSVELFQRFEWTDQALKRFREEHQIVFLSSGGQQLYPRWQFERFVMPVVPKILQIFKSNDELRVVRYFLAKRQELNGRRPLDLLRDMLVDEVLAHARQHAGENTW